MSATELHGRNNAEKIFNFLIDEGLTIAGACAAMANMDYESGLRPNNLQDSFEGTLGSDTYYTSAVNARTYTKDQFINDRAGYGLLQWTYFTRKRKLYEATVELGLSIADLFGQLKYFIKELSGYKTLDNMLRTSSDVNGCCDLFLKDFEAPAILDYEKRRKYAWKYYDLYANGMPSNPVEDGVNPDTTEYKTHTVKSGESWWSIAIDELKSGTRMSELAKFNGMTTKDMLHPGMILKIPELKDEVIEIMNRTDSVETPDTNLYSIYTVKVNDSWWKIAAVKLHDGSKMHELAKFNGRNTFSTLYVGEKIKIPITSNTTTITTTTTTEGKTHTVKAGEGWFSIALQELGDGNMMTKLAEYNGKTIKTMLHPGNVLKIPPK